MSWLRYPSMLMILVAATLSVGCTTDDPPTRGDGGTKMDTNKFSRADLAGADLFGQDLNGADTLRADVLTADLPQGPEQGPPPDHGTPPPDVAPGACTALTASGLHLNPGCDPDVQVNGITAFSTFLSGNNTMWLMMSGKKFWIYDPTVASGGAFTTGGENVSTYLTPLNPTNCTDTMGGVPLNPGCDVSVQANGLTAIDLLTLNGQTTWIFLSGTKFWSFNAAASSGAGAFTGSGADWAPDLRTLAPAECTTMMGGVHLNPGCDLDIQANGVISLGSVADAASVTWLLTSGKKFWLYSTTASAFTTAGNDFAASMLGLTPTSCTALTADGLPLNPGCDLDVQANGITASGTMPLNGTTAWLLISGKKFWLYDSAAAGGAGAFTTGGQSIAPYLRQLNPQ